MVSWAAKTCKQVEGGDSSPLLSAGEARPGLPLYRRELELLERVQ